MPPSTGPLPKSTVQLQKTQPMSKGAPTTALKPPSALATPANASDEEEFEYVDVGEGMMPLAIVVLVLAVVLLIIEVFTKMSGT